ncbi:phosphoglucosamine mutase [bacterium]|nr:phosphoglucosamine mutase [bacterium]
MAKLMTGISGIRGVIGEGLTPEVIARYGAAYGTFIGGGSIVVGSDARPSREMVRGALFSALTATGCQVIDINLATTPSIELMVEKLGASGGICITASHNPISWNAMKFLDKRGRFLGPDEGAEVNRLFETGEFKYVETTQLGKISTESGTVEHHIHKILEHPLVDISAIRRKQFRVAVDAVNSVGNLIIPNLLHELGCDVVKINADVSGDFARGAEPLPENLSDLCELVADEGADIGLALDPDGDRLAIVDEQGKALGEEYTLALAVRHVLQHEKGPVVANLSTTRAVEDIAKAAGVGFSRSPVGEAHVANEIDRVDAVIGGEGNGGVMLPSIHNGRDAMIGAALILSLLSSESEPLSILYSRLPRYCMVKKRMPVDNFEKSALRGILESEFGKEQRYNDADGIRVDLEEGWVHVRPSNTEPIVRIYAEAEQKKTASRLAERAMEALKR